VKARIRLENVLAFFENSELGQLIQQHTDKIYREAPFAMLKEDPDSKEKIRCPWDCRWLPCLR